MLQLGVPRAWCGAGTERQAGACSLPRSQTPRYHRRWAAGDRQRGSTGTRAAAARSDRAGAPRARPVRYARAGAAALSPSAAAPPVPVPDRASASSDHSGPPHRCCGRRQGDLRAPSTGRVPLGGVKTIPAASARTVRVSPHCPAKGASHAAPARVSFGGRVDAAAASIVCPPPEGDARLNLRSCRLGGAYVRYAELIALLKVAESDDTYALQQKVRR